MSTSQKISLVILIIVVLVAAIIIAFYLFRRYQYKEMKLKVENLLTTYIEKLSFQSNDEKMTIRKTKDYDFNFILEDDKATIYVKLVPNFQNYEILVNSRTKWQIIKSVYDDKIHLVEGIELPMTKQFNNADKLVKKLFIIYPQARTLMHALNECEYEFIYPHTSVYGCQIILFKDLEYLIKNDRFELISNNEKIENK